jgi:anaerobic magnesium-protoporphyrin IX monomethyl ester cyclase
VRHLKESDPDIFTITVAYPIKGTPLYQEVENNFIEDLPWETSTDRDIDFKRTYSRKYYQYAVNMIVNEVNAFKAGKKGNYLGMSKLKAKASLARGMMTLQKVLPVVG